MMFKSTTLAFLALIATSMATPAPQTPTTCYKCPSLPPYGAASSSEITSGGILLCVYSVRGGSGAAQCDYNSVRAAINLMPRCLLTSHHLDHWGDCAGLGGNLPSYGGCGLMLDREGLILSVSMRASVCGNVPSRSARSRSAGLHGPLCLIS